MSLSTQTLIVKVTNDCNYNCKYCLLEKNVPRKVTISKEIMSSLFKQLEKNLDSKQLTVIWHGGEPLLAGLKFFETMIEEEAKYDIAFTNEVQTNGSLITDEFADFFKNNKFNIGISIDGPQAINDLTRLDKRANSTFMKLMEKIRILREHGVPFGAMVTVSKRNCEHPQEIYDFFKSSEIPFQFTPLYFSGSAKEDLASLSMSAEEYTNFKMRLGEIWLNDSNPINISVFDEIFGSIFKSANHTQMCASTPDCHKYFLAIGPTGQLYPCCLFQGHDEFSYGNISEIKLEDITNTAVWRRMSQRKEYIKKTCGNCAVYEYCHGGCQFNAYSVSNSINSKDYYCYSYRQFIISMMKILEKKINSSR
jgi:uncharacterized protein